MGGVTELTILDGNGTARSMKVYSDNGSVGGNLNPLQALVGADGVDPASYSNPFPVASVPYQATALGYQQLTGISAATGLTVPGGATFAVIACEAVDARWRDDGSNPTGSVGMLMYAGAPPQVFSGDLSALRFVQTAVGSIINASFYS